MRSKDGKRFGDAIVEHFQSVHAEDQKIHSSFNHYLERHLFFITVSFRLRKPSNLLSKWPTPLSEFGRLHFKISRYLLGSHLNRKRRLQPLTYAFVDFEGSRQGQSDPINNEFPHVHALMLLAPRCLEKFRLAIFEPRLRSWIGSIKELHIENFSADEGAVEDLVTYCMKGHYQAAKSYSQREDLWKIFPA